MQTEQNKEFNCERLFEVITTSVKDKEVKWPVVAPNKKSALSAFRYLLSDNEDLKIVAVHHTGAATISRETVERLKHVSN